MPRFLAWIKNLALFRRRRVRLAHEVTPLTARQRHAVQLLLVAMLFGATVFLFPLNVRFDPPEYLEGTISSEEILAPFTFNVPKDEAELEHERALAAEAVLPVFRRSDGQALINELVSGLDTARRRPGGMQAYVRRNRQELGPLTLSFLASPDTGAVLIRELGLLLTTAENAGLVTEADAEILTRRQRVRLSADTGAQVVPVYDLFDLRRLNEHAAERGRELFGDEGEVVLTDLVRHLAQPNVSYDHEATELDRAVARDEVSPYRVTIQKGERIVDAHERITSEHTVVLAAMEEAMAARTSGRGIRGWLFPYLGRGLLVAVMVVLLAVCLSVSRPRLWARLSSQVLITTVALMTLSLAAFIARAPSLHPYLIPVPLAAILLTLLLNDELVALVIVAWLATVIGAVSGWGLSVVLVGFVGGVAAVYTVRGVTHRMEIYRSMLLIALAMTVSVVSVILVGTVVPLTLLWQDMLWALGNAILCTALAMALLPVFEKGFDLTTRISLLELSDLNRPIFRRMMIEANGTYHHSLVIGSLAEAAAEAIGADPLLARVGAYYHDVGKIAKPAYFGENMAGGTQNPHERLTATMSSMILESHVREGLELAGEIGLPGTVAAFIPEHQGTTLMQYFYNKALEQDPDVEEADYRYPGPKPQSAETAIVMLGDAAEATVAVAGSEVAQPHTLGAGALVRSARGRRAAGRMRSHHSRSGQDPRSIHSCLDRRAPRPGEVPMATAGGRRRGGRKSVCSIRNWKPDWARPRSPAPAMRVYLQRNAKQPRVAAAGVKRFALALLRGEEARDGTVTIVLTDDDEIHQLNRRYRHKDRPTDVLAFPHGDTDDDGWYLGDVIISLPRAVAQAPRYHNTPEAELARLLAHGLLHLLGFDHHTPADGRRMKAAERRALANYEPGRLLPDGADA